MINSAKNAFEHGVVSIPLDSENRPFSSWKQLKDSAPAWPQIASLNWEGAYGIGYVAGNVSRKLFCIDIDQKHDQNKTIATELKNTLRRHGGVVWEKFVIAQTKSDGYHLIGRSEMVIPNLELAHDETGKHAIIETRGQGGYFAGAPTPKYKWLVGNLSAIDDFSVDELSLILAKCRELTRKKSESKPLPKIDMKPGEDYNQKISQEEFFQKIITDGWREVGSEGQKKYLCRPGKKGGVSATFNNPENLGKLYVFSSSTQLPSMESLTPFAYKTYMEYGGNYADCAKALSQEGYGTRPEKQQKKPLGKLLTMEELIVEHEEYARQHRGTSTGYTFIDEITGGMHDDLMVLLAEPGAYKTTLLANILDRSSKHNEGLSNFFSLEMSQNSSIKRLNQMMTGMSGIKYYQNVRENSPTWQQAKQIMRQNKNLVVCTESRLNVNEIVKIIKDAEIKYNKKTRMIGIDYLDFLESTERVELDKIKDILLGIKTKICKEMGIPAILLCQTKRASEGGEVSLRDGKGGTIIEATADHVIGLWRKDGSPPQCKWLKHRDPANGAMVYSYGQLILGGDNRHYSVEDIQVQDEFTRNVDVGKESKTQKKKSLPDGSAWWDDN